MGGKVGKVVKLLKGVFVGALRCFVFLTCFDRTFLRVFLEILQVLRFSLRVSFFKKVSQAAMPVLEIEASSAWPPFSSTLAWASWAASAC